MKVSKRARSIDFSYWETSRNSNSWDDNKRWSLTISRFLIINMITTVIWFLKRATQSLVLFNIRVSASRWPQPGFNFRSRPMTSEKKKKEVRWIRSLSTRKISWWWTPTLLRTRLSSISYPYIETIHLTINMNSTTGRHLSNIRVTIITRLSPSHRLLRLPSLHLQRGTRESRSLNRLKNPG